MLHPYESVTSLEQFATLHPGGLGRLIKLRHWPPGMDKSLSVPPFFALSTDWTNGGEDRGR